MRTHRKRTEDKNAALLTESVFAIAGGPKGGHQLKHVKRVRLELAQYRNSILKEAIEAGIAPPLRSGYGLNSKKLPVVDPYRRVYLGLKRLSLDEFKGVLRFWDDLAKKNKLTPEHWLDFKKRGADVLYDEGSPRGKTSSKTTTTPDEVDESLSTTVAEPLYKNRSDGFTTASKKK